MLLLGACAKDTDVAVPEAPAPSVSAARARLRHLRFSSDKEKMRWERAIETVWKTPLGEMYAEYLFSPTEDHADLPLWARMLTERIFREPIFIDTRLSAIQVMNDDLYVREQMTTDVNDRITIITGHFDQQRIRMQREGSTLVFANAGASFLLALPAGSKAVQNAAMIEGRAILKRLQGRPAYPRSYVRSDIVKKFGHGYSKLGVLNAAIWIYPVITSLEWLVDAYYQTPGLGPKDQVLLLGLDDLVTSSDFTAENLNKYIPPRHKPKPPAKP